MHHSGQACRASSVELMLETIRRFAGADVALLLTWRANDRVAAVQVSPASPGSVQQSSPLARALCDRLAALRAPVPVEDAALALPETVRALWSPQAITTVFAVVATDCATSPAGDSVALEVTSEVGTSATHDDAMAVLIVGWRDGAGVSREALSMLARLLDAARTPPRALAVSAAERSEVEQRLDALMHSASQGVVFVDGAAGTAEVNAIAAELLSVTVGTVSARQLSVAVRALHERLRDRHRTVDEYTRLVLGDDVSKPDWVWEIDDAARSAWRVTSVPVGVRARHARLWTFEDVTVDQQMQRQLARQHEREQLLQRQKLEAVMRLAGGVAHDFTNLLTVISGSVEMIRDLPMARDAESDLTAIRQATQRANGLIRQLRAFSGQSVSQPDILLVDAVLHAMTPTLMAAVDAPWTLAMEPDAAGALIVMNERQFALALLNLMERLRNGMPHGGSMVLRSTRVVLPNGTDAETSGDAYVVISLGGDRDAADRLVLDGRADGSEQFGRGADEAGLGHATISAIVDQAGGHIRTTETGDGRRLFALFLPESDSRPILKVERTPARGTPITAQKHELPLLVVDDDAGPRRVVRRLLEREGYHILAADSASDALRQLSARGGHLAAVVTDYLMPGMSGLELLVRIRRTWPDLPVVLISGFTSEEVTGSALHDLRAHFLPKPFTRDELLQAIRTASLAVAAQ
jgi:CheY-like chemotaxis protein/signal transduction histidine kinase